MTPLARHRLHRANQRALAAGVITTPATVEGIARARLHNRSELVGSLAALLEVNGRLGGISNVVAVDGAQGAVVRGDLGRDDHM